MPSSKVEKKNKNCNYHNDRSKPCGTCQYCKGELAHTKEFLKLQFDNK